MDKLTDKEIHDEMTKVWKEVKDQPQTEYYLFNDRPEIDLTWWRNETRTR